jgi:hypothetical protein
MARRSRANQPGALARRSGEARTTAWRDRRGHEHEHHRAARRRPPWAESGPTGVASGRTGVGPIAGVPQRARNGLCLSFAMSAPHARFRGPYRSPYSWSAQGPDMPMRAFWAVLSEWRERLFPTRGALADKRAQTRTWADLECGRACLSPNSVN